MCAFLAYWLGIDALFYRLNRKAKRILTFHNILPDDLFREGVANGVSNKVSDFQQIITECSKKFCFSTDLFDAETLTVTFDDGYRNQYTIAFNELKKHDISAFVFIAGDVIEARENQPGLVVDLLTHWIDNVPEGKYVLDFAEGSKICQIEENNRLTVWSQIIWPAFMSDTCDMGRNVLIACDNAYSIKNILSALPEDYVHERLMGISENERDEMRRTGWKIGWHTKSHFPLAKLSKDVLAHELDAPEEFRGVCFSYPYGNPVEVGEAAIHLVQCKGYPSAVSNTNEAQENILLFFFPRMSVSPSIYRLHFQLSGLEYFLKHRRLLPVVLRLEAQNA